MPKVKSNDFEPPYQTSIGKHSPDLFLMVVAIALTLIGVLFVFDASYYYAQMTAKFNNNPFYFFSKQLVFAGIGIAMMFVFMFVDYRKLEKVKTILLVACVFMLFLVLATPLGVKVNGAKRWLNIPGFSLQPSELSKFALVVFLASLISRRRNELTSFSRGIAPIVLWVGLVCFLVMLQPNLSMMMTIAVLVFVMLFIAGVRFVYLAMLGLGGFGIAALLVFLEPYRMSRLLTVIDPLKDPQGTGYQLNQSLIALGAGGLFGEGFGNSIQKCMYLPYRESDFIFSIIGEEFGLVGCILLLAVFALLIWRGYRIAVTARDYFGSLLAAGITAIIAIQVIFNVGVVSGVLPPTGLTLPFISAGGSSLVTFLIGVGVLLNISRTTRIT